MADNDERRPGDWLHKGQRTYESANTIIKEPGTKKWYQETFWIIFFLVLFWPVGLVLMWRSDWHVAVKIAVTVVLAVMVYFSMNLYMATQQMTAGS